MLEFLQNNTTLIVSIAVLIGVIAYVIIREPAKIKEWLVWACAQAELSLGGGTGMLKLREVYDMFITQFPVFSKLIPFSIFKKWTEDSLLIFKEWLKNNATVQTLFDGDDNEEQEN